MRPERGEIMIDFGVYFATVNPVRREPFSLTDDGGWDTLPPERPLQNK